MKGSSNELEAFWKVLVPSFCFGYHGVSDEWGKWPSHWRSGLSWGTSLAGPGEACFSAQETQETQMFLADFFGRIVRNQWTLDNVLMKSCDIIAGITGSCVLSHLHPQHRCSQLTCQSPPQTRPPHPSVMPPERCQNSSCPLNVRSVLLAKKVPKTVHQRGNMDRLNALVAPYIRDIISS